MCIKFYQYNETMSKRLHSKNIHESNVLNFRNCL